MSGCWRNVSQSWKLLFGFMNLLRGLFTQETTIRSGMPKEPTNRPSERAMIDVCRSTRIGKETTALMQPHHATAARLRSLRRSLEASWRLRRRIERGVTSTSSSSPM